MNWTCRDGRKVKVKDMGTQHLRNAIALLRRKGICTQEEFDDVGATMCSARGEMAQMYAEGELMSMYPAPVLDEMECELESRSPA